MIIARVTICFEKQIVIDLSATSEQDCLEPPWSCWCSMQVRGFHCEGPAVLNWISLLLQ